MTKTLQQHMEELGETINKLKSINELNMFNEVSKIMYDNLEKERLFEVLPDMSQEHN